MTPAQTAVWEIYLDRLQRIVNAQRQNWERGHPASSVIFDVPSAECVKAVEKAMHSAYLSAVSEALGPVVTAIDMIDNSHTKSETVKAIRANLQEVYEKFHALKVAAPSLEGQARHE